MHQTVATLRKSIDTHAEEILALAEDVWRHPETGFRETRTSRVMRERLEGLGLRVSPPIAVTGMRAEIDSGKPGPTIAILAELDALDMPTHPDADPETGAAHSCGHHAQLAGLVACAIALLDAGIPCGRVVLIVCPAEELIELDYRRDLIQRGEIEFLGGKSEMIRVGAFDDIDLAFMIHAAPGRIAMAPASMNGFFAKNVAFLGRAAHAGLAPEAGVNALNAAMLALSAVHMQRETFPDADAVREHHVVTHGGNSVNIVPDDVRIEMMVRAKTAEAVVESARKVDRCLRAGALAAAGAVRIDTTMGYLPVHNDPTLTDLFFENVARIAPGLEVQRGFHRGSSTDLGDVGHLMPILHAYLGGAEGKAHGADFRIADPQLAYLDSGAVLAAMAVDLLSDDAVKARAIVDAHRPAMTRDQYVAFCREQGRTEIHEYWKE